MTLQHTLPTNKEPTPVAAVDVRVNGLFFTKFRVNMTVKQALEVLRDSHGNGDLVDKDECVHAYDELLSDDYEPYNYISDKQASPSPVKTEYIPAPQWTKLSKIPDIEPITPPFVSQDGWLDGIVGRVNDLCLKRDADDGS